MKYILQLLWSTLLLLSGSFIYFAIFHSFISFFLPFNSANMLLVSQFRLSHCPLCWRLAQLSVEFHFSLSLSLFFFPSLSAPLNTWQFRAKWNVSMSWFMYFTMRSSAAPPLLVLLHLLPLLLAFFSDSVAAVPVAFRLGWFKCVITTLRTPAAYPSRTIEISAIFYLLYTYFRAIPTRQEEEQVREGVF